MIEIRNLTKSYRVRNGRHYVFREVDADFPEGANIAIIGPNGGGKSTFLRILGGIDHPDSGQILTNRSFSWPLGLRGGFVAHMSGRDNCRMICNLYGLHYRHTRKKLEEIKELSGIGEYFEEPVKYYSSGMGGRLGFALSMAFSFDYFLIDEITSVGDAHFRELAKQTLEEKARYSKIIMVSHNMGDIKKFCDVGVLLKDGKLTVYEDLDEAIRAYLPQTKTAEADVNQLLRQASLDEIEIDAESLPAEMQTMLNEIRSLLSSIEARLADPSHELKGESADFYSLLGSAYHQLGDSVKAEAYHSKAIEENTYILRSQLALAGLFNQRGDFTAEEKALEASKMIDANHIQNRLLPIRGMNREGNYRQSIALAEETLKIHPKQPALWGEYAQALRGSGNTSKATDALVKAIRFAEKNAAFNSLLPGFYSQLSQMLASNGQLEQSVRAAFKAYRAPKPDPLQRYASPLATLRRLDKRITV
jgi:capsular polysaccharide transport system ATP-binding protein